MAAFCYNGYDTDVDTSGAWATWSATTASVTATDSTCWVRWVVTATAVTTAASTEGVWQTWATDTSVAWRPARREPAVPPRELTVRERAAELALAAARKAEARRLAAEAAEREEADRRAEELLVAHLDDEQKAEYAADKSFRVTARGGRRYRIHRLWSGHVTRLGDDGRPVERLCAHPRVTVPLPDNQLLAKLMLENDPEAFHRVANATALN